MDRVDILIPGAIGLLLLLRPQAFFRPSGSTEENAVKTRRFRTIGGVLLGVALLYTVIRLLSGS
jgi:hypothetical protein